MTEVFFNHNQIPDLNGYVAIVTGGTSGIGYETSFQLARHNARVYIACRSESRAREAIDGMKTSGPGAERLDVHFLSLDLMSLSNVTVAAAEFTKKEARLDLLVNNAGVMAVPYALTKDGFETQWQVNFLSPLAFTIELLPLLQATASTSGKLDRVRVVNVAADAAFLGPKHIHYDDPNLSKLSRLSLVPAPWQRYGHSKLASIMSARAINDRYQKHGITAYSLHPGVIKTNLQSADPSLFGAFVRKMVAIGFPGVVSIEDGALTTLFCATSPDATESSGKYHAPYGKVDNRANKWIDDTPAIDRLWDFVKGQIKNLRITSLSAEKYCTI